jgi:NADH:ubiquinone oxidoreductase subunit K
MMRLFVVRGTSDVATAQQFRSSGLVYGVGTVLSIAYLAVFLAGVVVAYRRRSALLVFLVPIIYVPVTIGFVLTNMRYSVTVQPLMFVFLALAVVAALKLQPAGVEVSESRT